MTLQICVLASPVTMCLLTVVECCAMSKCFVAKNITRELAIELEHITAQFSLKSSREKIDCKMALKEVSFSISTGQHCR